MTPEQLAVRAGEVALARPGGAEGTREPDGPMATVATTSGEDPTGEANRG